MIFKLRQENNPLHLKNRVWIFLNSEKESNFFYYWYDKPCSFTEGTLCLFFEFEVNLGHTFKAFLSSPHLCYPRKLGIQSKETNYYEVTPGWMTPGSGLRKSAELTLMIQDNHRKLWQAITQLKPLWGTSAKQLCFCRTSLFSRMTLARTKRHG